MTVLLSTWPQHTLQMKVCMLTTMVQIIVLWSLNQGAVPPINSHNTIAISISTEFCTGFYDTIHSEFLVEGNIKHSIVLTGLKLGISRTIGKNRIE